MAESVWKRARLWLSGPVDPDERRQARLVGRVLLIPWLPVEAWVIWANREELARPFTGSSPWIQLVGAPPVAFTVRVLVITTCFFGVATILSLMFRGRVILRFGLAEAKAPEAAPSLGKIITAQDGFETRLTKLEGAVETMLKVQTVANTQPPEERREDS